MNWVLAKGKNRPKSSDPVLIFVKGSYHIAVYDVRERAFRLLDQMGTYFWPYKEKIYWTILVCPDIL
jgi:hypothetical protein